MKIDGIDKLETDNDAEQLMISILTNTMGHSLEVLNSNRLIALLEVPYLGVRNIERNTLRIERNFLKRDNYEELGGYYWWPCNWCMIFVKINESVDNYDVKKFYLESN